MMSVFQPCAGWTRELSQLVPALKSCEGACPLSSQIEYWQRHVMLSPNHQVTDQSILSCNYLIE